ncbi:MAG: heme biosynthesis HemY N-terminal domain-containing protein [Woeseiaceae bacterium]|nr:heme biosynthesis HemY N-terminal domain-containing protein [Woeseiaceae bacterium]
MKFGLLVVAAILIGAFVASFLLEDPGYIVIHFRGYLVEMAVPAMIGLLALLVFGLWLLAKLWRAPRRLGEAAGRYRAGRAGQRLTRGMIEIAEGNFARGEKLLTRSAGVSDAPLLNYLQAARAAHLQGETGRRDSWLKAAYERMPDAANAVLLTQAELQLDNENYEEALATLRQIEQNTPNHSHALALLGRLYYRLEDWPQLAELLPRLRKHGRVDAARLDAWTVRVHAEQLHAATDADAVAAAWSGVPAKLKRNPDVQAAYFEALVRLERHDQAEKELAAALKRDWQPALVRIYGTVAGSDPGSQLRRAERWLRDHAEDPDLLLASARLCLRAELWGKARSYLETAIAIRPTPEAYHEYGRLLNRLGEDDAAAEAYRAGLGMVTPMAGTALPWLGPEPGGD